MVSLRNLTNRHFRAAVARAGAQGLVGILAALALWVAGGCPGPAGPDATSPASWLDAAAPGPADEGTASLAAGDAAAARTTPAVPDTAAGILDAPLSPQVRLAVEPLEGPDHLTVQCRAYTVDGTPLPEGTYTWYIDDLPQAGPMQTHATREFQLTGSGVHLIRLIVSVMGASYTAAWPGPEGDPATLACVTVWPSVLGQVRRPDGGPLSGVTVVGTGLKTSATSGPDGRYQLSVPYGWSGVIAPYKLGFEFLPEQLAIKSLMKDYTVDFIGAETGTALPPLLLAGTITTSSGSGLPNVLVTASGGAGSAKTDASGFYSLALTKSWAGQLTPTLAGYVFDPPYVEVAAATGLVQHLDFVASGGSGGVPISGKIRNLAGAPLGQVTVLFEGSGSSEGVDFSATTQADGSYTQPVPPGWSGRVCACPNHRFEPPERAFEKVTTPPPAADFTAFRKYYVAKGGSDAGSGLIDTPLATIPGATKLAQPGDTILLRGGTHSAWEVRFAYSGTAAEPITVQGYPGEDVHLATNSTAHWFWDFTDTYTSAMAGYGYYLFKDFKIHDSRHGWRFEFKGDGSKPKPHHVTLENIEGWACASIVGARGGGVDYLTIRNCDFHNATGTEGAIDLGNNMDAVDQPQAGSRWVLVENTALHDNNLNQQCNGIVTQGSTAFVTLRKLRVWNNAKYGLALKGSGDTLIDGCAVWGNKSSQIYLRGFVETDPAERTVNALQKFAVVNTVVASPRNCGGGTVIWRENACVRMYNCTVLALRDESLTTNGWPLALGKDPQVPVLPLKVTGDFRNCIFATWDGTVCWFAEGTDGKPYLVNRRYEGDRNLFWRFGAGSSTTFRYMAQLWKTLDQWRAYWAVGEPGGDDGLAGPSATKADANSLWANPLLAKVPGSIDQVPLGKEWPAEYQAIVDLRLKTGSPGLKAGQNLAGLGIPELMTDHLGNPRPKTGAWSIGAFENPVP